MTADYPKTEQVSQLRELWEEAFSDTQTFLDAFFSIGFSPRRCRCITENGQVRSALYWFEVTCGDSRYAYLYAVATASACRGRGFFSALLEDTKRLLTAEGFDGILLVPQSEALGQMYEKFGFVPCTSVDVHRASADRIPAAVREIGAAEFAALRRELLPPGGVLQEGDLLAFLSSQSHFWAGEGWLAVGQIYDGKLVCQEFLGDPAAMPGLVRALNVPEGEFRTPGDTRPFGWFLPLRDGCDRPAYFALALD